MKTIQTMRFIFGIFSLLPCLLFAQNSVLSEGSWYKLGITQTGIHKITAQNLRDLGIDIAQINPQKIAIYGNGGGMLPQANNVARYQDLQENAIWVVGEQDGRFDDTDYILFYAQNADKWYFDEPNNRFVFEKNVYSDKNYYFLTIKNNNALRIQNRSSVAGASQNVTIFDDYLSHEEDLKNILSQEGKGGSGREWYGEFFNGSNQVDINQEVEGIVPNTPLIFTSSVLSQAFSNTSFQVSLNGYAFATQTLSPIVDATYSSKGIASTEVYTLNSNQIPNLPQLNVNYTYSQQGVGVRAYLNYFRIQCQRYLRLYNNQTRFRSLKSLETPISNFVVENANSDTKIWDITNPLLAENQEFSLSSSQATFGANTDVLREFVVWQGDDFPSPELVGSVENQNLRALNAANLIIITHPDFRSEAERLADFRRSNDALSVLVVDVFQIYNEFSSGKQDVSAIRDFVRHLYLKNPSETKYLLLFGATSFDYKDRLTNNTNFVPIYESRESLHPIYSYSSDDYFGFMEENEGEWKETFNSVPTYDHTLEIGVGRLPVRTLQEAQEVVSKIIDYSLNSTNNLGAWRKNIVFLADDGDNNQHQLDADVHANKIEAVYPKFNVQKIYLDAYLQETNGGNERSPLCKQSLTNAVEKGALVLNYTGHGGEIGWTQEEVLRSQDFSTWNNNHKLPLMITATCEFGRYDEPTIFSGAEKAILSPKSGAIALITTTRPVFSSTNFLLNTQIYNYLFEPIAAEMPRLGDVIRLTKNNSLSGSINRNFSLLGDPSLRLAYPKNDILITKINQKDVSIEQDSLKALSKVSFEGEIRNTDNSLVSNFEGILDVTIFDKVSQKTTLGTQAASPMNFDVRENRLFNGKVSVKNGKFYFETIIPKDIAYNYGYGKISLYATDTTQKVDAGAGKTDIVVGGSNPNPIIDNEPPQIRLFMNDTSFVDGALVGQNPWLIAKLYDENGINISSAGVGHSLTAYLNDSTAYPRILNDFYTANIDTYKSGEVLYPFRDLPNGFYTLHFKAWDTFNNSAEKNMSFIVASNAEMALQNVFNYPNPFSEKTTFSFQHNRFEEELEVEIEIFNQKGEKMLQTSRVLPEAKSVVREFNLDLSLNGTKFADGVYVYKLTLRSAKDSTSASAINRLVIIKNP